MMNEKKNYKVQIFEEHYVLSSDEPEAFILKVAALVDTCMKEVSHQFVIADVKKIAILSALRIADKLLHCEREQSKYEQKLVSLKDYIDQEVPLLHL